MKKFLSLNYTDGKLFESSKEEKSGWEKFTSNTGKVTYRDFYLKGVTGEFVGTKFRESEYGNELQLGFKWVDGEEETVYVVSFKLKTQKGNFDDTFVIPLLQILPNLKVGETYTIFPYRFTPDNSKYESRGVSIKDADGVSVERSLSLSYYKEGNLVEGDIPAIVWKEEKVQGKTTRKPSAASLEARDEYMLEVLNRVLEILPGDFGSASAGGPNVTSSQMNNTSGSAPAETTAETAKEEAPKEAAAAESPAPAKEAPAKTVTTPEGKKRALPF